MKKLFTRIKESIRAQLNMKELCIAFALAFIGISAVLLGIGHRQINGLFLIEVLGMAIVFTLLFAMTKVYSDLLDAYYDSFRKK